LALAADPVELRALSDPDVYESAADQRRRVVTENVRDFRTLVTGGNGPGVIYEQPQLTAKSPTSARSWRPSAGGLPLPLPLSRRAEDW